MSPRGDAASADPQTCSIARALAVIGDRWTILVLRDCFKGIRRFDEIRRDLDIARPVLADRLKRLVDHGVLEKHLYQERPNRYEYRLTEMGRELSPILVALMRWGDHYLAGEAGPPTLLVHKACGHELRQGYYCASCHQTFSPADISSRPGPAALAAVDGPKGGPKPGRANAGRPIDEPNDEPIDGSIDEMDAGTEKGPPRAVPA